MGLAEVVEAAIVEVVNVVPAAIVTEGVLCDSAPTDDADGELPVLLVVFCTTGRVSRDEVPAAMVADAVPDRPASADEAARRLPLLILVAAAVVVKMGVVVVVVVAVCAKAPRGTPTKAIQGRIVYSLVEVERSTEPSLLAADVEWQKEDCLRCVARTCTGLG
jgi:hypothetical protein